MFNKDTNEIQRKMKTFLRTVCWIKGSSSGTERLCSPPLPTPASSSKTVWRRHGFPVLSPEDTPPPLRVGGLSLAPSLHNRADGMGRSVTLESLLADQESRWPCPGHCRALGAEGGFRLDCSCQRLGLSVLRLQRSKTFQRPEGAWSLRWEHGPGPERPWGENQLAMPRLLEHRKCEIINVCCFCQHCRAAMEANSVRRRPEYK